MQWIIFALLAAATWAIANIIDKYLLSKQLKDPLLILIILGLASGLASTIFYATNGLNLTKPQLGWSLLAGFFYITAHYIYFTAVKKEEISRVVPLLYFQPLFIALIATLTIGEHLHLQQYLGVLILIIGAILITSKKSIQLKPTTTTALMLLSSLCFATSAVITKHLITTTDFWTAFAHTRLGAFITCIPLILAYLPPLLKTAPRTIGLITINETINLTAFFLYTIAMSTGTATLVTALGSVQPFLVLIYTITLSKILPRILHERLDATTLLLKLLAITLMFLGTLLIT